jgi:hypothetical protein
MKTPDRALPFFTVSAARGKGLFVTLKEIFLPVAALITLSYTACGKTAAVSLYVILTTLAIANYLVSLLAW